MGQGYAVQTVGEQHLEEMWKGMEAVKCVALPEMWSWFLLLRVGALGPFSLKLISPNLACPQDCSFIRSHNWLSIWNLLRESTVQRKHIITLIRYLYLITGKHLITGRWSLVSTDGLTFQVRCSNYWSQASLSISVYRFHCYMGQILIFHQ